MELVRFADTPEYVPAGHRGVVNRLLAGRAQGSLDAVSVWHGALEPGGGSDLHVHDRSVQVYAVIEGTVIVSDGVDDVSLGPGDLVIIQAGERHDIHNRSEQPASLLVISAPALR